MSDYSTMRVSHSVPVNLPAETEPEELVEKLSAAADQFASEHRYDVDEASTGHYESGAQGVEEVEDYRTVAVKKGGTLRRALAAPHWTFSVDVDLTETAYDAVEVNQSGNVANKEEEGMDAFVQHIYDQFDER